MRTKEIGDITANYPDAVVAAFARNPITIEGFTGTSVEMKVTNNDTGVSVIDKRAPLGGSVFFDLAYYLQVMFNQEGINEVDYSEVRESATGSYTVLLTFSADSSFSFDVTAVWASALQSESESLRMYEGYPFTVGVFADESHTVKVGSSSYSLNAGLHTIPVSGNNIVTVTTESEKTRTIKVTQQCGDGIYLRWIDRMGIFRYWLFAKGNDSTSIEASGEYRRLNTGLETGIKRVSKAVGTSVEICAPLVDSNTFGFLLGLAASPLVSMYDNGEWVDVDIEAGDIVKERTSLQDFIVTLVLPETIVQKL